MRRIQLSRVIAAAMMLNIVLAPAYSQAAIHYSAPKPQLVAKACANKVTGVIRLLSKGSCNSKVEGSTTLVVALPAAVAPVAGAAGPTGAQGVQGSPGKDGSTVWSGSGSPAVSLGNAGDFYIDTAISKIYGPKGSVWSTGVSLTGPRGDQGATGPAGLVGPAGPSGPAGFPGASGAAGVAGLPGATGATGAVGAVGAVGPKGETGTAGVAGPQGVSGVSGAALNQIWFSPEDMLPHAPGSTSSLTVYPSGNYAETALNLAPNDLPMFFRATPSGWSQAVSTTWTIYWAVDAIPTDPVVFEIGLGHVTPGESIDANYALPGCNDSCAMMLPGVQAVDNMYASTVTIGDGSVVANHQMVEGDLLHVDIRRDYSTQLNGPVYQGNVYIFGISVKANFA